MLTLCVTVATGFSSRLRERVAVPKGVGKVPEEEKEQVNNTVQQQLGVTKERAAAAVAGACGGRWEREDGGKYSLAHHKIDHIS